MKSRNMVAALMLCIVLSLVAAPVVQAGDIACGVTKKCAVQPVAPSPFGIVLGDLWAGVLRFIGA